MNGKRLIYIVTLALCAALLFACAKEEKEEPAETEQSRETEQTLSYLSEDISFGVFFDESGTKRTLKLGRNQKEFDVYIIVQFPEDMEIAAVEWRLVLPEGVTIVNDKYVMERSLVMGVMEHGISERFPCAGGPAFLIHTLTLNTDTKLENAEIAIMPSEDGDFLGIAECIEGFPRMRAISYKGVVNPEE